MNDWLNEWIDEQRMTEWMNRWTNELRKEWANVLKTRCSYVLCAYGILILIIPDKSGRRFFLSNFSGKIFRVPSNPSSCICAFS